MRQLLLISLLFLSGCDSGVFEKKNNIEFYYGSIRRTCTADIIMRPCGATVTCYGDEKFYCVNNFRVIELD